MIKLERFTKAIQVIAPLISGWGQYDMRRFYFPEIADGWYLFNFASNITIERKATPLEVDKLLTRFGHLRVYAFGTEGVPLNFNNFVGRGFAETVKVNFLNLQPFQLAKIVLWEDGRFYFWEADNRLERETIRRVRGAFEKDESITGFKYITPELRYYYLLLSLQKQSVRQLEELEKMKLSLAEKKKRMEEFRATFAGRLEQVIVGAGGKLVKFTKSRGNSYTVEWRVGGQSVKSEINDELRIISAGFCLDGDDASHSMNSIINLAKMFQEDSPLYITRE